MVFYNEIDKFAASWLRELIKAGHIADGIVDERSIEDIEPDELMGFTQCHFFAGIGVWSYALRQAGWPDTKPVWTGSCPCQPFSAAGKGAGFTDERHLWPAFNHLVEQCKPDVVFGEQVASKDGLAWIDLVLADLEGQGYAAGATDTCAAGFGAPHIRQRLYWVADSNHKGSQGWKRVPECSAEFATGAGCVDGGMANTNNNGCAEIESRGTRTAQIIQRVDWSPELGTGEFGGASDAVCGLANADGNRREQGRIAAEATGHRDTFDADGSTSRPAPNNGFWRDADWLYCRDGKWRPVEPGTFPLVDGATNRVGRLRGYGNAINAEAAKIFIEAYLGE